MSLSISRIINSSYISTFPSLNPTCIAIKPNSHASFSKNKDLASSYINIQGFNSRSLQYDPMFTTTRRNFVIRSNITPPPGVPIPSGSPSGSMRNWIVGIVLTCVIPFFTHKWGSLLLLKNKVDTAVNTVEYFVETIEEVATKVDHVIDDITDDLPENSQLRKRIEAVDSLVEEVAKTAHTADDIIDKVEAVEDKLEAMILKEAKGKEKVEAVEDKLEAIILKEAKGDEKVVSKQVTEEITTQEQQSR